MRKRKQTCRTINPSPPSKRGSIRDCKHAEKLSERYSMENHAHHRQHDGEKERERRDSDPPRSSSSFRSQTGEYMANDHPHATSHPLPDPMYFAATLASPEKKKGDRQEDTAPEDRKRASKPSKRHHLAAKALLNIKGSHVAPSALPTHSFMDDAPPQPPFEGVRQRITSSGPPNDETQVISKRQVVAKTKPAKKRRVAREKIRGDDNKKHPTESLESYPSSSPNQGAHGVQEGRRRGMLQVMSYPNATPTIAAPSTSSRLNLAASILRVVATRIRAPPKVTRAMIPTNASLHHHQHDYHELEMAAAALSRIPQGDLLYRNYSRGNPGLSSSIPRLATTLALSQPSRHSQQSQSSLSDYDEQELVQETLQRRRDYNTRSFSEEHVSILTLRQSILTKQILGRRGHQYAHSSAIASTMPVAVASISDHRRHASDFSSAEDALLPQLWERSTSFSQLLRPHETHDTAMAETNMAREESWRRKTEDDSLLLRPPSSSGVAVASASSHGCLPSLFTLQRVGLFEGRRYEENHADVGGRCNGPSSAAALLLSSEVSQKIPPCDEGPLRPYTDRSILPLSGDKDENRLSAFLSFIRSDLVEVFRASGEDVASRVNSKKIIYHQIGIRCRFCAHIPHDDRARRSATFPSSIDRIYQSLTMMIREHFVDCAHVPKETKEKFASLKAEPSHSTAGTRQYWNDSARKLGMVDIPNAIMFDDSRTRQARAVLAGVPGSSSLPNFSNVAPVASCSEPDFLVEPNDRQLVSDYLYTLMMQVQRVVLKESERVGNRKAMKLGTPGLGCRHCCSKTNRKCKNRSYPSKRRLLPTKMKVLHQHVQRCSLCPQEIKLRLAVLVSSEENGHEPDLCKQKTFFDRIWARIHGSIPSGVPADPSSGRHRTEGGFEKL